ncbi:MAG: hypothetical protein ABSH53_16090 [Holophaga sp.]|jgi:hypothetical protein
MSVQGWLVLVLAALAALAGVRKLVKTLARKGQDAGCCCDGSCGRARRKPPETHASNR